MTDPFFNGGNIYERKRSRPAAGFTIPGRRRDYRCDSGAISIGRRIVLRNLVKQSFLVRNVMGER